MKQKENIKMMRAALILFVAAALACPSVLHAEKAYPAGEDLSGTITVSGAWALYPMMVRWAEEFQKIHPKVKIDVSAGGAGKGVADSLARIVDIGMVSREIYPEEISKGAWWVSVTKDAVVPTCNEKNPLIGEILRKGARKEHFVGIWITKAVTKWGELAGSEAPYAISVYTRSDACGAAETWAKYLGEKQEGLLGIGVYGDPGLAQAVQNDELGIGYNNINYAYDAKTKRQIKGIAVLPIDLNGNGAIDADEKFYDTRYALATAIAAGKYPSPPTRELNLVSGGKPEKKEVTAFIHWILTDGQRYVPEAGYINLTEEKLKEELKKL